MSSDCRWLTCCLSGLGSSICPLQVGLGPGQPTAVPLPSVRAKTRLDRAKCLVYSGELTAGVEYATETVKSLDGPQRKAIITLRGQEIVGFLPEREKRWWQHATSASCGPGAPPLGPQTRTAAATHRWPTREGSPCPDRLFLCGSLALFEGCPDLARLEIEDLAIRGTAVTALRCAIEPGTRVDIQIQTNGVRLDEGFLDLFKRLRVWPPRRSRQIHPSPVSRAS